jgi:hypothetical protein
VIDVKVVTKTIKLKIAALTAGPIITNVPAIPCSGNIATRVAAALRVIAIPAGEQHRLATTVVKTTLAKPRPAEKSGNHAAAATAAIAACIVLTLTAAPV